MSTSQLPATTPRNKMAGLPFDADQLRRQMLEKAGITEDRLVAALAQTFETQVKLLTAKTTKFFAHEGVVMDERQVDDNAVQARAVELNHDFLGTNASKQRTVIVKREVVLPDWATPTVKVIDAPTIEGEVIDLDTDYSAEETKKDRILGGQR